jgi:two-component sensor histidine kinase/CHASE3 domain sensor protein
MPLFSSVIARRTFGYLLAGALALLAIVAASIWLAARTVNHADEIARARTVRTLASTVLGALLDAETGQRGFLLTHEDRYLEPYEQAQQRLPNDLSRLRALAADDPRGTAILDRLVAVSNEKLAELAETIRLDQAGEHAAALALVNDDLGRRLMDEARGLLGEFTGQAEARVNDRLKQLDDAVTLLMWTTIAGSILILLFTGAASYTVMSYTRGLIAAQQQVVALNATLEDRVRERTAALLLLLDEVNHRVANSLALVASLAHLQANTVRDAAAREALQRMQARIMAIAGIHRRLYTSSDVRVVELEAYLEVLVQDLDTALNESGRKKAIVLRAEPGVQMPTDKAVWLGVIVTELVTNAYKYAYAPSEGGEIRMTLQRISPALLRLVVEDDGVGWAGDGAAQGSGLGTRVINAMATSLGSTLRYDPAHRGTRAVIEFKA